MGSRAFRESVDLEAKRKKAEKERQKKKDKEAQEGRTKKPVMNTRYGDVLEATQDRRSGARPRMFPDLG